MNMLYAFQLGRIPLLGLAELAAVFPGSKPVFMNSAIVAYELESLPDPQAVLDRLGGVIRIIAVEQTRREHIHSALEEKLRTEASRRSSKIVFGISQFGTPLCDASKTGMDLKRMLRSEHISVRFVKGTGAAISTAAVIHNDMLHHGAELVTIADQGRCFIGTTLGIQDIEAYTMRDMEKPVRDMHRGMLPPKLAQIMLNLAQIPEHGSILDPFCGSGTILMEALLHEYTVYGSDSDKKAINDSMKNTEWLADNESRKTKNEKRKTILQQCTAAKLSTCWKEQFDAIVTEGSLGPLLTHTASPSEAEHILNELLPLYRDFFAEASKVTNTGATLVITTPLFRGSRANISLPKLKLTAAAGSAWTLSPLLPGRDSLVYERSDQFVGRELWRFKKTLVSRNN